MMEYLLVGMFYLGPLPPPPVPTLEKVISITERHVLCQWSDMRFEYTVTPYRPRLSGDDDRTYCVKQRMVEDTGESWQ